MKGEEKRRGLYLSCPCSLGEQVRHVRVKGQPDHTKCTICGRETLVKVDLSDGVLL